MRMLIGFAIPLAAIMLLGLILADRGHPLWGAFLGNAAAYFYGVLIEHHRWSSGSDKACPRAK